ncbi:MAG: hypothetical protein NTZ19_15375 [Bacteroidetes bacterium]|nr:hypothetical protein [Bacteroidota bacterium]
MNKTLLGKLTLATIGLSLSLYSFAQEAPKAADIKVEGYQLQAEGNKLQAQANKLQAGGYRLQAEDAKLQSLTVAGYKKVDPKDLKSKEISMELPAAKTAEIFIENSSRNLDIKVWDQPKVKVVTTILYEGDASKVTDAEWFEKINLTFRSSANTIRIKTAASGNNFYKINGNIVSWGGANFELASNESYAGQGKAKKTVTIYIPKENNLDLESKYAEVVIDGNLNKLTADITNGGLELGDVSKLFLRSKYSNVTVGNIKTAEVELINGRFIAKDADDLDLDTKYATIEAGSVKKLMVRSTNDEYEIEEVGVLTCRKNYGNLRITKLNTSIELDGTNADIKVRNIGSGLELIKINDKYADIRLPMRNVKNYNVAYQGAYSTVYAGFEKKPVVNKEETKTAPKGEAASASVAGTSRNVYIREHIVENDSDSHFTATVGDGKGAKLDLKCQNCTVDFK